MSGFDTRPIGGELIWSPDKPAHIRGRKYQTNKMSLFDTRPIGGELIWSPDKPAHIRAAVAGSADTWALRTDTMSYIQMKCKVKNQNPRSNLKFCI